MESKTKLNKDKKSEEANLLKMLEAGKIDEDTYWVMRQSIDRAYICRAQVERGEEPDPYRR
jgi:hypothetical protein